MASNMDRTQEQITSPSLIRLWSRRMTLAGEEPLDLGLLEDIFPPAQEPDELLSKSGRCSPLCSSWHDYESELSDSEHCEEGLKEKAWPQEVSLCLDGALLGDIPARYTIPAIRTHEFPVVGVWVDPRVAPGFRYRVRPIQEQGRSKGQTEYHYFFGGKALTLQSIGRGYTRRVTFEGDSLNDNDNYFWSDSWPLGFAFELEVTRPGEKYTLYDANSVAMGTSEIVEMTMNVGRHPNIEDGRTCFPPTLSRTDTRCQT